MYDVYGVGNRIASYRKLQGLTQEELAARLNITAQAVSKWENGLSFPEITILPYLAKELNVSIEKLLGNEDKNAGSNPSERYHIPAFPETKGYNLKLVHTFGNVACYSQKEVKDVNKDTVIFKDGSSANLNQLKIINKGTGEICFDFIDEIPVYEDIDSSKTEFSEVYDGIQSIDMAVAGADFKVVRSKDSKTYVKATGSPIFIEGLKVIQEEERLSLRCEHKNNRYGNSSSRNVVIISFGSDCGENIRIDLHGSGDVSVEVPFKSGYASINGSGDITTFDIDDLEARISGSGDIKCSKAGNPRISINGSGDFEAHEVSGFLKSSISGSGDISLGTGDLDIFEAVIRGSGDIDAEHISTRTANLSIEGSGDITIGRVMEESVEKHSKSSSIKVLKRG
ncbi:MAG: DUF2807 domain-containing protein [Clostridiales bacterium]|nr:DUF2807 domain-containing protein [Clostridiales bacterium]HBM80821.1 hypothetical protein [Clostridiaceae bacterium]